MGSLGCPLCCQQIFGSVGALRDHLIYYIYRPLQCGVCTLHLEGIQEFIHHLKSHMGDGLPATAKFPHPQPTLPAGGESNTSRTLPPTDLTTKEITEGDPDSSISNAQVSDGFSNCVKDSEAANQLLKLREWQLEKWGKNFSLHRTSFGKSPAMCELSPVNGRTQSGSPPMCAKDLPRISRPSSQNSCYTTHSDLTSHGRNVDSVERFDFSSTPSLVYDSAQSQDAPKYSIGTHALDKEVEVGESCRAHSFPSNQTVSSPLISNISSTPMPATSIPNMPSPSVIAVAAEMLSKDANSLGDLSVTCSVSPQSDSVASPLYVQNPPEVELASCTLPPSSSEVQELYKYGDSGNDFNYSDQTPLAENRVTGIELYERSNKLPLLESVDSDEQVGDIESPPRQYHELQPVTRTKNQLQDVIANREHPEPFTFNKEHHHSVPAWQEQFQQVGKHSEPKKCVTGYKEKVQSVTLKSDQANYVNTQFKKVKNMNLLQPPTLDRRKQQQINCHGEVRHPVSAQGMLNLWESCSTYSEVDKQSEISGKHYQHQQSNVEDSIIPHSHFSDNEDNFISGSSTAYSCSTHEAMNPITKNPSSDKGSSHDSGRFKTMSSNNFMCLREEGNTCFDQCPDNDGAAPQASGCEGLCSSSGDIMPYLHKKFHHDQERKLPQSTGVVDQIADVSQYINSFQSVLVRKLNGTLSAANLPVNSDVSTTQLKKSEKELKLDGQQPHQPKEYTCDVCHLTYKNLSSFKMHCGEHKQESQEDSCTKDLCKVCPKDLPKGRSRRRMTFKCAQCSKIFPKAFNFNRHMKEVHSVKKLFTCVQCNKSFSSKRHLQEHSDIHKDKKAHECHQCHHLCYTASGLRTHTQEIHSGQGQPVLSCDVCDEKFAKVYGLKRHKERKHNQQQMMCHFCSKTFSCKEDLKKHIKTHDGTVILKCDSCDKKFSTSWALQRHSETHQRFPKTFKCNMCSSSFTRKDSLVSHLKVHSQKKKFVCFCGKRFVKKSQLREHEDKHSSVPKYSCPVCKHSFKFRVSLKNHSCKRKEENLEVIE